MSPASDSWSDLRCLWLSRIIIKPSGCERGASADEIRKAYRKLARKHHPDLNPGDKAAEDRFKKVQEAYDILSDPKKKQMYDQYGFYSENGCRRAGPAARARAQRGPNMGFGGFDFSDAFARGAGGAERGARRPEDSGQFSGYFQPVVRPAAGRGCRPRRREKGSRSRIRPEHRFLAGHQGHAGAAEHHPPGNVRDLRRHRRVESGHQHGLSGVQRQRQRDAGGRAPCASA